MAPKQHAATKRGYAVVSLRDGRSYEGQVSVEGGLVHLNRGRRRVREMEGITYRSTEPRSWPPGRIGEVRWLEGSSDVPTDMADLP